MRILISTLATLVYCLVPGSVQSDDHAAPARATLRDSWTCPFYRPPFKLALGAYQALLGPARVLPCSMYPSCSDYASAVFDRTNPIKAILLTSDRLQRCGKDRGQYDVVWVDGFPRLSDPPPTEVRVVEGAPLSRAGDVTPVLDGGDAPGSLLDVPESDDGRLFHFAAQLQADGDHNRAITEYRRLLSYFPESSRRLASRLALAECYSAIKDYREAARWGRELLVDTPLAPPTADRLRLLVAESYLRLEEYSVARFYLDELAAKGASSEARDRGKLLKGLAFAREGRWSEAGRAFDSVDGLSSLIEQARQCRRLADRGRTQRRKKPGLAAVLSLVPGLGYAYSGSGRAGLSSFMVNGLFAWAAVESFRKDRPGAGVTLSTLGVTWYAGNIFGAALTARRYNERINQDVISSMEEKTGFKNGSTLTLEHPHGSKQEARQ